MGVPGRVADSLFSYDMSIKAAFFDIDGTLVGFKDDKIRPSVIDVLRRAREGGLQLFIASGRPKALMGNLRDFPFDGYVMMNGALVKIGDKVIYSHPIPRDSAASLVDTATRSGIAAIAFLEEGLGLNFENEVTAMINDLLHVGPFPTVDLPALVRNNDVYEFTVYATEEEVARLEPKVPGVIFPRWHPRFCDAVPEGVSKADAIERTCRHLGLGNDEVIVFGDGGNDIPMLEWAHNAVVMGNATPEVKAYASFVTKDVDDGGVEFAMKAYGLI